MRPLPPLIIILAFLVIAGPAFAREAGDPAACPGGGAPERLQGVTDEGDLRLEGAGVARLAGIRFGEERWAGLAVRRLRERVGETLLVLPVGRQDRWGRLPVRLGVVGGTPDPAGGDLASVLVREGLAVVGTEAAQGPCRGNWLGLEAAARERGLGLWGEARYTPVPASDTARLLERIGRFTLVEGRIRGVGERTRTTFLNFSSDWANDFTIIIPKRVWASMTERGIGAAELTGRRIRARGVLEARQGPALTLSGPEAIELLDAGRGRQGR